MAPRSAMTDRPALWATIQVGRSGRTVAEVARELGCDWHTVNDAVLAYGGALIDADVDLTERPPRPIQGKQFVE